MSFRYAAAGGPPVVDQPTQFPDATSSDTPARVSTPILFNVTAHDEPSRNLTFTIYWNYITDLRTGQGDLADRATLIAVVGIDGNATVSIPHTYGAIGPLFQQDTDYNGVMDLGAYYVFVDVGNGVGNGTAAASSWVAANRMPSTTSGIGSDSGFYNVHPPNHTFTANLDFTVFDLDNDTLTVTWDFGDGTPLVVQVTPPARSLTDVVIQHVYDVYNPKLPTEPRPLSFLVNATVDDGHGHRILPRDGLNTTLNGYLWKDTGPQLQQGISYSPRIPGHPEAIYINQRVNFSAEFNDTTPDPLFYYWDFNNDSRIDASGPNVFYSFGGPPEGKWYDVWLYVTDGDWKLPRDVHNASLHVSVFARDNLPPDVLGLPSDNGVFNSTLGSALGFYYQAYDEDGDNLTFSWDYGDGHSENVTAAPPGDNPLGPQKVFFNHSYARADCTETGIDFAGSGKSQSVRSSYCVFHVTVRVSDGHHAFIVKTALVHASSLNLPPKATCCGLHQEGTTVEGYFVTNRPLSFTIYNLTDNDSDLIYLTLDFGDGSSVTRVVQASPTPQDVKVEHTYTTVPKLEYFAVYLNMTDKQVGVLEHNPSQKISVKVEASFELEVPRPWNWIDYASLSAVFAIPAGLVAFSRWKGAKEEEENF